MCSTSRSWLFLKVETDAGISGWGDGSAEWLVPMVETTLHEWKELLIVRDPLQVIALCEDITNRLPWKGGPVIGTAIAAINMALYDIAGKAWGVPVHTILGGKRHHRIRVYCNGGTFETAEEAAAMAKHCQEQGYTDIKGNPLESRTWPADESAVQSSLAGIAAIRQAVGDEFDIMLDAHGQPDAGVEYFPGTAGGALPAAVFRKTSQARLGRGAAGRDPGKRSAHHHRRKDLHPARVRASHRTARVRRAVARCNELLRDDDIVEIARRAEHAQPHNVADPVGYAATLHADAVMNNFLIQETTKEYIEAYGKCAEHDFVVEDGYVGL